MNYPFRYLQTDGFWKLVKDGKDIVINSNDDYATLNQLSMICDGGMFVDDLWEIVQDKQGLSLLRNHIQSKYFAGSSMQIYESDTLNYLEIQAEKLKKQASAKFRVWQKIEKTDGYFVRSQLFPKFIKEIYDFTCCVCRESSKIESYSLIDGAHIMPFSVYHNNDPRNGLALCKNHHWGFDHGAWSLTDQYQVLVSPKLMNGLHYIESGKVIIPPKDKLYLPDLEALKIHREYWGFNVG
jgi:putative restriction endonuclease